MKKLNYVLILGAMGLLTACSDSDNDNSASSAAVVSSVAASSASSVVPPEETPAVSFTTTEVTKFTAPWAMTFLPDGRLLVTEMTGDLHVYDPASDKKGEISGVPETDRVSQGGLGDVVLHPDYATNSIIYISYVEKENDLLGGAVARARLELDENGAGSLEDLEVIWRQVPKTTGEGHFGYRMIFDAEGKLWISSSERQKFDPAQDMNSNLGKIIRLNDDGSIPTDNPFVGQGEVASQVWSLGHRNILGMAFAADGRLWAHEMGPKDGDELNLIEKGVNYGYPIVSNGNHYDDTPIPDHSTRPEFRAPLITWTPVISPAGFIIYDGNLFAPWNGNGFIGGLSSQALIRVEFDGESAREAERFDMQRRIREVEQGPDGAIWLLEDGNRGGAGWLLKLTPTSSREGPL